MISTENATYMRNIILNSAAKTGAAFEDADSITNACTASLQGSIAALCALHTTLTHADPLAAQHKPLLDLIASLTNPLMNAPEDAVHMAKQLRWEAGAGARLAKLAAGE